MERRRENKVREEIAHRAAEFFARVANRDTLITITSATLSPDLKRATIYFTAYPEDKEEVALTFTKRKRSEFRKYLGETARLRRLPAIDFEIDRGEKNRRRIDELLQE